MRDVMIGCDRFAATDVCRRYAAAVNRVGLRALPFHSLGHYSGSMAVNRASLVQVQSWMVHAAIQTTARYLHAKSQADDAALLAGAFTGLRAEPVGRPAGVATSVLGLQATYDRRADVAWFRFARLEAGSARTEQAEWGFRAVDQAAGATVVLEFWRASERLPAELLDVLRALSRLSRRAPAADAA